jgi:hypothetical protein
MSKQKKRWSQLTAAELAGATRQYDEPFAAIRESRPMTSAERARYRKTIKRGRPRIGKGASKVYISMERGLLRKADAYAKTQGISRSELIARGVRSLIGSPT